jgi:hypothetical protein
VRAASTGNLTLEGYQTIDGVTFTNAGRLAGENMRVLVKNQTDPLFNGIYVVDQDPWQRAQDFNGNTDFIKGTFIIVAEGTINGDTTWRVTSDDPPSVGEEAITFAASSSGGGDLLAANNLSDIASAATAFANIKQAATTAATGVVELATDAETLTGTDTARALTPSNLTARTATETRTGIVELATEAEAIAGVDASRAVTPAGVKAAIDGLALTAVLGPASATDNAASRFDGTDGTLLQDSGLIIRDVGAADSGFKYETENGNNGLYFGDWNHPSHTRGLYLKLDTDLDFAVTGEQADFNAIIVENDELDVEAGTGSKGNGLLVYHGFGSGTGGRHAVYGALIQEAASAVGSVDRNYVGIQGQVTSATGDGGTNLAGAPTSRGAYFGSSAIAQLLSGATNTLNLTGCEFNTQIETGASTYYRSGIQVVDIGDVRGSVYDACYVIGAGGTATWRTGIAALTVHGIWPFDTDSTFIQTEGTHTMLAGFDFAGITYTDFILKTTGMLIGEGYVRPRTNHTFASGEGPKLQKSAINGALLQAATGSTSDLALCTPAGNVLIDIPTGTNNLQFLRDGGGTASFNGTLSATNLLSGTYTPTLTNVANTSSLTAFACQYLRVGNSVTVSGKLTLDPITAATLTQIGISLPIASDFATNQQCGGVGSSGLVTAAGAIYADTSNNRAEFIHNCVGTAAYDVYFTFTYVIV